MLYQLGSHVRQNCTVLLFIVQKLWLLTVDEFGAFYSAITRLNYIVSTEIRDRL